MTAELSPQRPLVVDLDGTLIRTDLLVETAFAYLGQSLVNVFHLPLWLSKGKAVLKRQLADAVPVDVSTLPYNEAVLTRIRAAREAGRPVYLASASDGVLVRAVSDHLGLFDGWFASDGDINLSRENKAELLVRKFGERGYDYIGNGAADLPVWSHAANIVVVGAPDKLASEVAALNRPVERVEDVRSWRSCVKLLRPHQWAKNALVAVPLLTAHQFSGSSILLSLLAMTAFSLCASSVYILNDLIDIQADRVHPSKRKRPFASGDVSFETGAMLEIGCLVLAFGIGAFVSLEFLGVLFVYFVGTTAYSFLLKRKMLIDAVTLGGLYTVRIIGGAAAIGVPVSEWLMAFSMFIFLSLALIKRHSEMAFRFDAGLPDPTNRNYKVGDLPVIAALSAASGYCAVIVLSLYLSSDTVRTLYRHPSILWLVCPLMLYWISRMLMLSHRRLLDDDPIVFAIRDKVSWATGALVIVLGAIAF